MNKKLIEKLFRQLFNEEQELEKLKQIKDFDDNPCSLKLHREEIMNHELNRKFIRECIDLAFEKP